MAASSILLLVETAALALSVSYVFEVVDVLSRRPAPLVRPQIAEHAKGGAAGRTYIEPVEVEAPTLNRSHEATLRT